MLDTNVISLLAPARMAASAHFLDWLAECDSKDQIFLSVITVHEIEKGIALLDHKGAVTKVTGLKLWLAGLIGKYADKILPFDTPAAVIGGQLEAAAIAAGHAPGMADAAIAGIAVVHGLAVVTANTRHFMHLGVDAISPEHFSSAPG